MATQNERVKASGVRRDDEFYYESAIFLVEDRLFKIPIFHLSQESEVFRAMFSLPQGVASVTEGLSDESPIVLEGVKKEEFKQLLRILYSSASPQKKENFTKDQWTSVLMLSSKWDMTNLRKLSIDSLTPVLKGDPHELILYGRRFDVNSWLFSGIEGLIDRKEPMDEKDANVLGIAFAFKIAATRETLHAMASKRYKTGYYDPHGKVASELLKQRENFLQTEFGLASNNNDKEEK